jgi:phage shock protein A
MGATETKEETSNTADDLDELIKKASEERDKLKVQVDKLKTKIETLNPGNII